MARPTISRNQRFKAALAMAGITAREWARQNEVSHGHLSQVVRGIRHSATLAEKIDTFIAKHVRAHAA